MSSLKKTFLEKAAERYLTFITAANSINPQQQELMTGFAAAAGHGISTGNIPEAVIGTAGTLIMGTKIAVDAHKMRKKSAQAPAA